jgi:hypothetical protein
VASEIQNLIDNIHNAPKSTSGNEKFEVKYHVAAPVSHNDFSQTWEKLGSESSFAAATMP